jgi:hypothetical protein
MKKSRSLLAPSRSLLRPAPVPRSKSSLPFGLSSDPGSPGIDEAALAEFSDTIACVQVLEQSFPRSLLAAAAVSIPKGVSIKQNPSDATVAPAPFPVVLVSQLYGQESSLARFFFAASPVTCAGCDGLQVLHG